MIVVKPRSLTEALRYLQENLQAKPVAGGTDLLPRLNQGLERREALCCLSDFPELTGVRRETDGRLFAGALTRLAAVSSEAPLAAYPALCEAASQAASPQIRNQGTLGGNILQENRCIFFNNQVPWSNVNKCFKWGGRQCFQYKASKECVALFQSDIAPVLIAYGAQARLRSAAGERELPVEALYLPAGRKAIAADEILLGVLLPPAPANETSAYVRKTIRGAFDFPLLSCAVRLRAENGVITEFAAVLGAAGVKPARLDAIAAAFPGAPLAALPELCRQWQATAATAAAPFHDTHVNPAARKTLAATAFTQATQTAAARCGADV